VCTEINFAVLIVSLSQSQLETLEDEDRGHFDEVVAKLRVVQCLSLLFHTSADASLVPSEDRLIKVFDALQDLIANIIAPLGSATGKSMAKVDPAVGSIVSKLNSGLVALFQQFSDYFSNIELNELILGRVRGVYHSVCFCIKKKNKIKMCRLSRPPKNASR